MSAIDATISVALSLAKLIEAENDLLIDRRPSELAAFEDEKAELTVAYQQELTSLRDQPGILANAAPETKAALKEAGMRLVNAMDVNRRKIVAARTVAERMIKAVTDELAKRSNPVQGYTAAAVLNKSARARGPVPTALAFHEVV
jgi:hypothetical protein